VVDTRGLPWEHDPGPAKGSGWPELFADTPNYRGLGRAVLGREAFRWHFGPMFYRGRLDGTARVLVVGQEGAQDESLAHRSFTGGTGARMQHFLRHIGLDRSYLFLNTFVYPIFGQYTTALEPLAQDLRSPIVAHRHRILDKVVQSSDLRLVIAVGRAAKQSMATWIAAHGGSANPDKLHLATPGGFLAGVRFLGVVHPGSASSGGGTAAIKVDFARAVNQVRTWLSADSGWLPADPGVARDFTQPFAYRSAPIPYRDFPFGTTPRLGRGGTSSNRSDNQRGIQLFSAGGKYNGKGASLRYSDTATGSDDGYEAEPGDVAVEPPRAHPRQYDAGPPAAFARLLLGGEPGLPWPDFAAAGVTSHPSFGVGAVYRGRFSGVSIVVLADQTGPDDLFCGRALCGEVGQRFQGLLAAAGLSTRYLVVRTVPVDTADLTAAKRDALVDRAEVRALHSAVLARLKTANSGLKVLLALGRGARRLAPHVTPPGLTVIELKSPPETGSAASWQAALDQLATLTYTKDTANPSFVLPTGRSQIPRADLPYGAPRWVGSSGNRASRPLDRATDTPSADYLKLYLPAWVAALPASPLSPAEQAAADQLS